MEVEEEASAGLAEEDSKEFWGAVKDHTGMAVVGRKFGWVGMFVSCSARSLPCTAGSSDSSMVAMKSNSKELIPAIYLFAKMSLLLWR